MLVDLRAGSRGKPRRAVRRHALVSSAATARAARPVARRRRNRAGKQGGLRWRTGLQADAGVADRDRGPNPTPAYGVITHDVAIVGAGPTGLALANLLGGAGVHTIVLERNAATASEPRAVIMDDESMRALQAMGLADAMLPHVREGRATRYVARPDAAQPFAEVNPQGQEYGWPKRLRIHQPDLERVLRTGLERFGSVEVRYDTKVASLRVGPGEVALLIEGGDAVHARRVVACDGGSSAVRRELGIATTGDSYAEPWLVVDLVDDPFDPPDTTIVCDPRRPAVSVPGPHRRRRFEFMIKHGESRERFLEPATIARLLADYGYDERHRATIDRQTIYVFHARSATELRRGPVLLAGDAAHMMPPFMGQGLNSCIRDAWNLGWKLALDARGVGGEALLDSYETERRPHVEKMIATSVTVAELAMTTSRIKAAIRNLAFTIAKRVPSVRRHINGQFFKPRPEMEEGLFVMPMGHRGPVAKMLPQARLGGRRLDDVLGDGFALVGLGIEPRRDHHLWHRLGARSVRLGPGGLALDGPAGALHVLLDEHAGQVLVVRPDRYVAGKFAPDGEQAFADALADLIGWQAPLHEAAE
ncbi:MAG: bifunctional 3-(3-hydroxy-phenyl)propionate/3-hydroxycinnamic acid hydroxylase [Sphingomonas sp.]|nr:MAG: bifunctional 3-(3-hydroxy-phenyl)propionate/3-hydroxycinnamic acid hydroxylase [Sphingomonas sp.]